MEQQHPLRPWADLPSEILSRIASKCSPDAAHYVSLRRVCRGWRHSLTHDSPIPRLPAPQPPFLLIPPQSFPNASIGRVFRVPVFINFLSPKPIDNLPQLANTEKCNRICIGSSHGWLITLDALSSVSLLNPVTADSIPLQPLSSIQDLSFVSRPYPQYHLKDQEISHNMFTIVHCAILSSDPTEDPDFILLLFLSGLTARCFTCRGREHKWISHDHPPLSTDVEDVVFVNGVFVAFNRPRYLRTFDFRNHRTGLVTRHYKLGTNAGAKVFLVQSDGHLMMVFCGSPTPRVHNYNAHVHVIFCTVHQFPADGGPIKCTTMTEPRADVVLFLGHGCSLAVSKQHFPWLTGMYYVHPSNHHLESIEGEDMDIWWFNHAIVEQTICCPNPVMKKLFEVEELMSFYDWKRWKSFWITPNIRRFHG